jgi:hypothetical protein
MQWKSVLLGAAIATTALLGAGRAFSGDGEPAAPPAADPATQPGPEHEALAAYEGDWEGKGTATIPGAPGPIEFTAHQTGKMVLGGRFLQMEAELSVAGMTMHSLEYVGFDVRGKKYVHVAMGDDSTRMSTDEGQHDAAKKGTVMRGVDPLPGGGERKFRYVITDPVDGKFGFELYHDEGQGEHKVVEATYTRK